jgi:intracellular septation protein
MVPMSEKIELDPRLKLAIDIGPLALFFVVWWLVDIFVGTAVLIAAVIIALIASYALTRRWPIMLVVSAAFVVVFGGLTVALHDPNFIKVKLTIVYTLFGGVLLGGYLFDKPMLAVVFDSAFHLTAEGWRKLTVRWVVFFFTLAALNEVIRNTQSDAVWGTFKGFCFVATFIFAAVQYPLLMRHAMEPVADRGEPAPQTPPIAKTDGVADRD